MWPRPPPTKPAGTGSVQASSRRSSRPGGAVLRLLQAPAVVALAAALAVSTSPGPVPPASEPLCNLPPTLSGEDGGGRQGEANRIRHPKSDRAARCTSKCVSTCVLGGYGAPGVAGPFNIRRYDHWWCSRTPSEAGSTAWWSARTSAIYSRTAKMTSESGHWTQQCKKTSSPIFHGVCARLRGLSYAGNGGSSRPAGRPFHAPDCSLRAALTSRQYAMQGRVFPPSLCKSKGSSLATKVLHPVKNTHTCDFPWSSMRMF